MWAEVLVIAGLNLTLFASLATLVIWTVTKHDTEIKSIANRLDGHAARIDQLYSMFVDLIKHVDKEKK